MSYRVVCKVSILNSQDRKSSARGRKLCSGTRCNGDGRQRGRERGRRERKRGRESIHQEHGNTGRRETGRHSSPFVRQLVVTKISKNQITKTISSWLLHLHSNIHRHRNNSLPLLQTHTRHNAPWRVNPPHKLHQTPRITVFLNNPNSIPDFKWQLVL